MFHKESIDTPGNARVVQRRTPGCLLPFSLHHGRGGGLSPPYRWGDQGSSSWAEQHVGAEPRLSLTPWTVIFLE